MRLNNSYTQAIVAMFGCAVVVITDGIAEVAAFYLTVLAVGTMNYSEGMEDASEIWEGILKGILKR